MSIRFQTHRDDPDLSSAPCEQCGTEVFRYKGEYSATCPNERCQAEYNSSGQRLRSDWRGNPSNYDSEISDLEGYERQHAGDE